MTHARSRVARSSRGGLTASLSLAATLFVTAATHAGNGCSCAADLNGTGTVDAADLAILLGNWGTGDQNSDLNNSGSVEAADLGVLLGAWGACGAPANDNCFDAEILPAVYWQDVALCTTNATTDGPASAACDSAGSSQIFQDVWFKVASPTDGMLKVTTCGADFDTRLAVYEPGFLGATCPQSGIVTAFMLGCNDDSTACANDLNSQVLVPVVAGETYTIRAGGFLGAAGTGNLAVDFHQKGDLIEDAIDVTLADNGRDVVSILTGDTLHATPSEDPNPNSCGGVNDAKDLWFRVVVQCNNGGEQLVNFTASTCMPGTNFDTTLTVYTGTPGNLVEVECNDDETFSNCMLNGVARKSFVSLDPVGSSAVYWVRLAGFNGAVGNYEIKFSAACL